MDLDRQGIDELDAWLAPFPTVMGRKTRRTWAPHYLRGLLGPGDRKSLQPMAMHLGLPSHEQLQHSIVSLIGDGPVWGNHRHLPGAEGRLVGEWRSSGERKYYLSNLPHGTSRRALAGTIKARWVCE